MPPSADPADRSSARTTAAPSVSAITTSIHFVRGMLIGFEVSGVDVSAIVRSCGIDPALLREAEARVTGDQYLALFERLLATFGDEGLLLYSRRLRTGSFALMMRPVVDAPLIESALQRLCSGFQLLQDDVRLSWAKEAGLIGIRAEASASFYPERGFIDVTVLRVIARVAAWLHDSHVRSRRVDLRGEAPPHAREFSRLFQGDLRFGAKVSTVWFDRADLELPVQRDADALADFIRHCPRNICLPLHGDRAVSARVRTYLQAQVPEWPQLAEVASALRMSVKTLQRHLLTDGKSFQTVKDQLRRDLAIARLTTTSMSLTDIAHELGFAESAAFQRAFKQWTGSAPGSYRRNG